MELKNILNITTRETFREWLVENHDKETECWMVAKKGKSKPDGVVWYLDAVEEVLCFGWIDTMHKNVNGVDLQRFTPRTKRSPWTELNKERVRRLEKLGLMTDAGRAVLPDMRIEAFKIEKNLKRSMKRNPIIWENFLKFHPLYQRVRVDSVQREIKKPDVYKRMRKNFLEHTKKGEMYGEWNDYGRLLDY